MSNDTKLKIANLIGESYSTNATYKQLLENIYNNSYRNIYKVPIETFILGILESFKIRDLEHINKLLIILKEVVKEVLEISGIELSYADDSWEKLEIIENTEKWADKYKLLNHRGKSYMSEFFEI